LRSEKLVFSSSGKWKHRAIRSDINITKMNELHIEIKVIPNASKTELIGFMENDVLKIKVKGVPEKGKANQELIRYLEEIFNVKRGAVRIIAGETSRLKHICIAGKEKSDLQKLVDRR